MADRVFLLILTTLKKMKNDAMPVYAPHMSPATKFLPYLRAAEDGAGRAQHEGSSGKED